MTSTTHVVSDTQDVTSSGSDTYAMHQRSNALQLGTITALKTSINAMTSSRMTAPTATVTPTATATAPTSTSSEPDSWDDISWPPDSIPYDFANNLPTTPTGDPVQDMVTLWEGLTIMESCGGGAWEVSWCIEFIAGMAETYEDSSGNVTNQTIADFFSTYGATLETQLIDEVMMNYYAYCVLEEGEDASTAAASTAQFAQDLESVLSAEDIDGSDPIAGAMYTELETWDSSSEVSTKMSSYWYTDSDGTTSFVIPASSSPTGEMVYLSGDDGYILFEEYSNDLFYTNTFDNASFSGATDALLNDIVYSEDSMNLCMGMCSLELTMELYSYAYTLSFLQYETECIDDLIEIFDVDDTFGTVTSDEDSYSYDGGSDDGTPSSDEKNTAMEFMSDFENLYLNAAFSEIGQETGLADTMSELWTSLCDLPAYSQDGDESSTETLGDLYYNDEEDKLCYTLAYYQSEDAAAITDLLDEATTATTDLSSTTTTMVSITSYILKSCITAWYNYDNSSTTGVAAVNNTAVNNQ